jgi:hypothetical protein
VLVPDDLAFGLESEHIFIPLNSSKQTKIPVFKNRAFYAYMSLQSSLILIHPWSRNHERNGELAEKPSE